MSAHDYEEIVLELAHIEREAYARIAAKMRAQQLGEAWIGLVDDRGTIEGGEVLAA